MVKIVVKDDKSRLVCGGNLLSKVRNHSWLKYEHDFWVRKNSNFNMPKYRRLVNKKGFFLTGLLRRVEKILDKKGIEYKVYDKRKSPDFLGMDRVKKLLGDMKVDGEDLSLRGYQKKAIAKGISQPRGLFEIGTGGGKSIILAALLLSWWKKSVVVIDSRDLAYQLQEELSEYTQQPVGFVGDGIWNPKKFTVAIDRTLLSGSGDDKKKNFLSSIECLIFDEVHHLQSKTWRKLCRQCSNAKIRFGFSATPQTSSVKKESGDEGNKNQLLEGYVGPTLVSLSAGDLVKLGWLAEPTIYMIENMIDFDGNALSSYHDEYSRMVIEDEGRNQRIAQIVREAYGEDKQVVGFVDRIEHGERVREEILSNGLAEDDVAFVHGSSYNRSEKIDAFRRGVLPVLIGTVLSEGLNFFCDVGINIAGGKSAISTKQRIGRILRKQNRQENGDIDPNVKEEVDYYDFCDNGHPYFSQHAKKRKEVYREEDFDVVYLS